MVMVFACVGMVDTYDQAIDNLQLSLQGYNNIQPKFIKPWKECLDESLG